MKVMGRKMRVTSDMTFMLTVSLSVLFATCAIASVMTSTFCDEFCDCSAMRKVSRSCIYASQ